MDGDTMLVFVEAEVVYSKELGALVNCYAYAKSRREGKAKVTAALVEDGYHIIGLLDCYRADEDSFAEEVDEEHGEPTRADLALIRGTSDVYYANFHTYPLEDGGGS